MYAFEFAWPEKWDSTCPEPIPGVGCDVGYFAFYVSIASELTPNKFTVYNYEGNKLFLFLFPSDIRDLAHRLFSFFFPIIYEKYKKIERTLAIISPQLLELQRGTIQYKVPSMICLL